MAAPYACRPEDTRGRAHDEPPASSRDTFQRDRDRIIHSSAFRRLEYKTQVFVNHEGDHYRTRLTHSLEVAQLARSISRRLGLNIDLTEALSLAHDLGHTPFGHAGEEVLESLMEPYGGFCHNAQALRVLIHLEERYAAFDGLNLTWETLEGVLKHNGPITNIPEVIAGDVRELDLRPETYPTAEAQVATLADDIAYNNHDMEDGLRAGLFTLDDLMTIPFLRKIAEEVYVAYGNMEMKRHIHEINRRAINRMVEDVLRETMERIDDSKVASAEEVRMLGRSLVSFSEEMQETNRQLKEFLMTRMYRHYRVNRMTSKARRMIGEMFTFFLEETECLPTEWQEKTAGKTKKEQARVVCDFIAGMTDRFAMDEHRRLFQMDTRM